VRAGAACGQRRLDEPATQALAYGAGAARGCRVARGQQYGAQGHAGRYEQGGWQYGGHGGAVECGQAALGAPGEPSRPDDRAQLGRAAPQARAA
jgi:hypothetical protein